MMPAKVALAVGTSRGLFLLQSDAKRSRWSLKGPYLKGWQIYHAVIDTRGTPTVHAAGVNEMTGTTTFSGSLRTLNFRGAKTPPRPPKLLPVHMTFIRKWNIPSSPMVWHIEPGHASEKKVLYAGVAPAALFRSEDSGRTWQEVTSLTRHPTRKHWSPGAGGMCLHSIQVDPGNRDRILVAISAAGVFRTEDGGRRWLPVNRGVKLYMGAPKDSGVGT